MACFETTKKGGARQRHPNPPQTPNENDLTGRSNARKTHSSLQFAFLQIVFLKENESANPSGKTHNTPSASECTAAASLTKLATPEDEGSYLQCRERKNYNVFADHT